jgi:AmmeMemoRadiSam system protein A
MPSTETSAEGRRALREAARAAAAHGAHESCELEVEPERFAPELRAPRASFVTLRLRGELRGCTGSLEAVRALVADVARSAYRSARCDPRFPPVGPAELPELALRISLLGPLEPLCAASEAELLARLRPRIDGLVVREGAASATFLPAVWASLPEPTRFLCELRRKAGLDPERWSQAARFERYVVEEF